MNETDGAFEPAQARVAYQIPVTLVGDDANGDHFSEATIAENVARGGAFVRTMRPLAPGTLLALHEAEHDDRRLAYVQVVWVRPAGEVPSGAGVRIVNGNGLWMEYLVSRSVRALDDGESTD